MALGDAEMGGTQNDSKGAAADRGRSLISTIALLLYAAFLLLQ